MTVRFLIVPEVNYKHPEGFGSFDPGSFETKKPSAASSVRYQRKCTFKRSVNCTPLKKKKKNNNHEVYMRLNLIT